MEFDLRKHTILLTVAGSRAYGIHTETSDVDMKGVGIAPKRYHMGCFSRWEQAEGPTHMDLFRDLLTPDELQAATSQKLEGTIFHLPKILGLAADANPNILDGLFCRDQEVRLSTPLGDRLRESRGLFISTKAKHTFSGYAASQLKRIRGHRSFLLNPPKAEPKRSDFGLPDQTLIPADQLSMANAAVQKRLDEWAVDFGSMDPATEIQVKGQIHQYMVDVSTNLGFESGDSALWLAATRSIGLDSNLIYVMQQERGYKTAIEYWRQYQGWVKNRNPERAALEAKFGYDTKHGAHLVRLLRMGREILTTGQVHVWRGAGGPGDAEELLSIRRGEWSYDRLVEWAEREDAALDQILKDKTYVVPRQPDRNAIEALCVDMIETFLKTA